MKQICVDLMYLFGSGGFFVIGLTWLHSPPIPVGATVAVLVMSGAVIAISIYALQADIRRSKRAK